MATLREYFDTDFANALKIYCRHNVAGSDVEIVILSDFSAFVTWVSCYVAGQRSLNFFIQLMESLRYGQTAVSLDGKIVLPAARTVPGVLTIANQSTLEITVRPFGSADVISWRELTLSKRLVIYSESDLSDDDIRTIQAEGRKHNHEVLFRSSRYVLEKSRLETPLAFISHDSRDKEEVARKIAIKLQGLMCPVWYDEFSLQVGSNLRDSIESGLKSCDKCILVLSPNFLSNNGWTKKEFDSIFTREVLEQRQLVLPVWYGVTKEMVYDYSPSLANVKGVDWAKLGEDEVCNQLARVLLAGHPQVG
jgi:hypothetical protein